MLNPKELPAPMRLKYIVDAMEMRARGRSALKEAEFKRKKKANKRMVSSPQVMHRHLGLVDDADYGASIHLGCRPYLLSYLPAFKAI